MTLHCHPVFEYVCHTLLTTQAISLQTLTLLPKSHINEFLSITITVNICHIGCIIKAVYLILVEVLWKCTSPVSIANSCLCCWTPTLVPLLPSYLSLYYSMKPWRDTGGTSIRSLGKALVSSWSVLDFFFYLTVLSCSCPIYPPKCSHAILNFFYGLSGADEFLANIDFPQLKKNVMIKRTAKPHFDVSQWYCIENPYFITAWF